MVEVRVRKNKKIANIEPYEPPEDKFGVVLTINDTERNLWRGYDWFKEFSEKGETVYDSHDIRYAYIGMPVYIYLTSKQGIVADAVVGSDEDLERMGELDSDKATSLINLRLIDDPIDKDELIELKIFKKVPIILKYISKNDYETIESLFEEVM